MTKTSKLLIELMQNIVDIYGNWEFLFMLSECKLINIKKIGDERGYLSVIESTKDIEFIIKRIYYLYDVPFQQSRGEHAHKKLQQLIIPISGSFDIELDDGFEKKKIHLSQCDVGLYISTMTWRIIENFSKNAVCMVLCSEYYDPDDYIRDYQQFLKIVRGDN